MTMHHATVPTDPPLRGIARHLPPGGLMAIAWTSVVLAGVFVAARIMIRITRAERLGWDDYWVYFAYAVLITNAILQTLQTPHLYYLNKACSGLAPVGEDFLMHGRRYVHYELAITGLFWTVLWSIKASFLALYWKLFQRLEHYKKWWMLVVVFSFLAYVGCWITSVHVCHPLELNSKKELCNTTNPSRAFILVSYSTTVDVLSNIMIICLPLNMLYNVRLATKQKLGLASVFSLSLIIIIVAIARGSHIGRKTFKDGVLLAVWGIIESTVSVVVGCLPPFKCLFQGRRGSSASRPTLTPDLITLRPYHAAIRVQSTEIINDTEARPGRFQRISTRLRHFNVFAGPQNEEAGRLEAGVQVRSDCVRYD